MTRLLSDAEVAEALRALPDWTLAEGDAPAITATYELVDFVAALDFVSRVGAEAEQMNHHPDIDIRYTKVVCTLSTHDAGGITQNDLTLAGTIEGLAAG